LIGIRFHNINFEKGITLRGERFGIEVSGHSGTAVKGNDIVCAGVSALAHTLVLAVERVAGIPLDVQQKDGYLSFGADVSGTSELQRTRLMPLIEFFIIGVMEIRKLNSDSITIYLE
jgi:uncharacterized protein YsxB (DUF464 family)